MTPGENPILRPVACHRPLRGVKPTGEAAFNLPQLRRTILRMGLNPAYDVERAETILSRVVTAVLENEASVAVPLLETQG